MNKISSLLLLLLIPILLSNCKATSTIKEEYLSIRIPMLKKNLTHDEYEKFKEIMDFDAKGNLNVMNFDLFKKGTDDKYDSIQYRISSDMVGFYGDVVLVDSLGIETSLTPKLVTYTTIDNKSVDIKDFTKENTVYMITSVNCGPCLKFIKEANKIANDPKNKDFHFVALYADPAIRIENYKKGSGYEKFGMLNEQWLQFNNEQNIIKEIKQIFKGKPGEFEIGEGFPELFYYKKGVFERNPKAHELQEVLNDLKKTLANNPPKTYFE